MTIVHLKSRESGPSYHVRDVFFLPRVVIKRGTGNEEMRNEEIEK